jgi:hypothetical protein
MSILERRGFPVDPLVGYRNQHALEGAFRSVPQPRGSADGKSAIQQDGILRYDPRPTSCASSVPASPSPTPIHTRLGKLREFASVSSFGHWLFGFPSDFDIRISDLVAAALPVWNTLGLSGHG